MAVTITTQFYEFDTESSPDSATRWHDLSTVVFTSPNLASPSDAETRSHILPGAQPLGIWYEVDEGKMWRIFNHQIASQEMFYPVSFDTTTSSGFSICNSIVFKVTSGESYNNRLTAWDSVTHNSTSNYLIDTGRVKASCANYSWTEQDWNDADFPRPGIPIEVEYGGPVDPNTLEPTNPFGPQYNITLKGNTVSGSNNYYGDFNMIYSKPTSSREGDVLIVRPWLDNINSSVPYGNHDFVITLHYSYT